MDIKSAIKQTAPFRSQRQEVMVNLMFTHSWMMQQIRQYFKPFGITNQQYNILRILKGSATPLSTKEIRDRLLDKMSDTTRVIDRMLAKGLVKKIKNKKDKRLVDITLSKKGLKTVNRIEEDIDSLYNILENLSDADAKKLSHLLDKCRT